MNIHGKVYLVGGAVRDTLLGKTAEDQDYVIVGGSQENLLSLGFKQVGADFPVFLHPETNEEYALARIERKSGIGYNGFTVETDGVTLMDDLARRDFTINAMAFDGKLLIDPFNGRQDLEDGIVRHVSNAFKDDPLRVLRAFRFAARYNFVIAEETLQAIREVSDEDLKALVPERIFLEVTKAISDGKFLAFFTLLRDNKLDWILDSVLFPLALEDIPRSSNNNINGVLTAVIANGIKAGKPISDFNAIAFHKKVAEILDRYEISEKNSEDVYALIRSLGDWNSNLFKTFMRAKYVKKHGKHIKLSYKALWFVYNSVTSKTVLEVDSSLQGPALGDAIKAARIEAIRNFLEY